LIRESRFRVPLVALGVLVVLMLVAPILVVVAMSFTGSRLMEWPPTGFSFQWYEDIASNPLWVNRLTNSLLVGLCSATLATILGTATALGLVRGRFRGRAAVLALVLGPLVVPSVVVAIGMYFVWVEGWTIGPITVGSGLIGSLPGLVLAHAALNLPLPVITVSTSLITLDRNLEMAAAGLGASPTRVFMRITLPLAAIGVVFGFVFAFLGSWDEAVIATLLSGPTSTTIPVEIYNDVKFGVDPSAAAISSLLLLASTVVLGALFLSQARSSRPIFG
jgi:putative spermidine/putrescine transport system permease protein